MPPPSNCPACGKDGVSVEYRSNGVNYVGCAHCQAMRAVESAADAPASFGDPPQPDSQQPKPNSD